MATKRKRGPATMMFDGKRYELCGSASAPNPNIRYRGHTDSLRGWAKFQRQTNGNLVRVVKIAPSVWEAYIHYPRRQHR
jgi:hypothetical protein